MTGRAMAVPSRYVRAYMAPARSVGNTKSRTNSSRRSSTTQSMAPERLAFSTRPPSSPAPWPTSAAKHSTRAPYFSRSQGTIAEVSSPPEYARTTNGPMGTRLTVYAGRCINIHIRRRLSTPRARVASWRRGRRAWILFPPPPQGAVTRERSPQFSRAAGRRGRGGRAAPPAALAGRAYRARRPAALHGASANGEGRRGHDRARGRERVQGGRVRGLLQEDARGNPRHARPQRPHRAVGPHPRGHARRLARRARRGPRDRSPVRGGPLDPRGAAHRDRRLQEDRRPLQRGGAAGPLGRTAVRLPQPRLRVRPGGRQAAV